MPCYRRTDRISGAAPLRHTGSSEEQERAPPPSDPSLRGQDSVGGLNRRPQRLVVRVEQERVGRKGGPVARAG